MYFCQCNLNSIFLVPFYVFHRRMILWQLTRILNAFLNISEPEISNYIKNDRFQKIWVWKIKRITMTGLNLKKKTSITDDWCRSLTRCLGRKNWKASFFVAWTYSVFFLFYNTSHKECIYYHVGSYYIIALELLSTR